MLGTCDVHSAEGSMTSSLPITILVAAIVSASASCTDLDDPETPATENYRPATFTARDFPFREVIKGDRNDRHSGGLWGVCLKLTLKSYDVGGDTRTAPCEISFQFPHYLHTGREVTRDRAQDMSAAAMNRATRERLPRRRLAGEQTCKQLQRYLLDHFKREAAMAGERLGVRVQSCDAFKASYPSARLPEYEYSQPLVVGSSNQ